LSLLLAQEFEIHPCVAYQDCQDYLDNAASCNFAERLQLRADENVLALLQVAGYPIGAVAYRSNALSSMAMVKEQIMLNGGVFTSMALSPADFLRFVDYKPAATGVFTAAQPLAAGAEPKMHAVFRYGWWDNPRNESDGYWLCKNR
jgi:hypothetical protein